MDTTNEKDEIKAMPDNVAEDVMILKAFSQFTLSPLDSYFVCFTVSTSILEHLTKFLAEITGTAILLFVGCMGCVKNEYFPNDLLRMALNFGIAVTVAVQSFGCVSGAHINPAVTLGAFICGKVNWILAGIYFIGQILGALIGYGLMVLVLPYGTVQPIGSAHALCITAPNIHIGVIQAFFIEIILTGILLLFCCAVWDPRNANLQDSTAIKFGLIIASLICTGGPLSGAGVNPVRSLAPAIFNNDFTAHWIYWIGPLLGSLLASTSYRWFVMKLSTLEKISCFLAELIGTGLLVFLGCMGCVKNDIFHNNHLQAALNFGLVVMIIIQSFGCISGAHLNPAVTVAASICQTINLPMAGVYFVGQMLGGFIGYGLLKVVLPFSALMVTETAHGFCVTAPHPEITTVQALCIEFIITAVLALVCCGVWDSRNARYHDSVALRFGFTIACLAITGGPFTGGSMNPARSFGPALWNNDFAAHWIYWVGPLAGAAIASAFYRAVFRRRNNENNEKLRAMEEVPLS